jgi:hypothetical protein
MPYIWITNGVGSNPKLWAIFQDGAKRDQVGEFDLSPDPGWYDPVSNGISGMSGIVWKAGQIAETYPRKLYRDKSEWLADLAAEYPYAEMIEHSDIRL